MFSQLYRLRVWITHWLTLAGYFPATKHPPAWRTLFASLFFVPSATGKSLTERIEPYFPHINFHHLRLSDGLRFVLQGLWLLLLHPPRPPPPAAHAGVDAPLGSLVCRHPPPTHPCTGRGRVLPSCHAVAGELVSQVIRCGTP